MISILKSSFPMPRVKDQPASNFIRFLSAYGPDSSNGNRFDEKVFENAKKYNIKPFYIKPLYLKEITEELKKPKAVCIFIAGVAGDGKSFLQRNVWIELGGKEEDWINEDKQILEIELSNDQKRKIIFIKDLSAINTGFDEIWEKILNAQKDPTICVVIACNHGQILKQLRTLDSLNSVADQLEDIFFEPDKGKKLNGYISIYDLSRASQTGNLQAIIQCISMHECWKKCEEENCEYLKRCPIRRNIDLLWDKQKNAPTIATQRLCKLIQIAGLDQNHFTMRELFMLAVNAILGLQKNGEIYQSTLGSCHTVKSIITQAKKFVIDLYANLLGNNLSSAARIDRVIFRKLEQYEIGEHSDPFFDDLIQRAQNDDLRKEESTLVDYFKSFPKKLSGSESSTRISREELRTSWRRQLFFSWTEDSIYRGTQDRLWMLSAYAHMPDFFNLINEKESRVEGAVLDGLNRVMTGCANEEGEYLRIATNGANSREPVGRLKVATFYSIENSGIWLDFISDGGNGDLPFLRFTLLGNGDNSTVNRISMALTPRRYEFLHCLSEGALPTAFTGQTQSEFYSLKYMLVNLDSKKLTKNDSPRIRLEFVDGKNFNIRLPD